MAGFLKRLPFARKSKYEFYVSFAIVCAVAWIATTGSRPEFAESLVGIGALLVAFFCALNAAKDAGHMNAIERFFALFWFYIVSGLTFFILATVLFATFG